MATRRRPNMGERIDSGAATPVASVTAIARGRNAFSGDGAPAAAGAGTAAEVAIALIDPSPANPRSSLGDLEELAASIRELGVLQPVMVRPTGDRYALVYGHRRLAAATLAGDTTIPVLFAAGADDEALDQAQRLVENLHREDLSALDEARAYQQLLSLGGAAKTSQRQLAKRVSRSQAYVSKRLALLRLPDDVQAAIEEGSISVSDATSLTKLVDDPERIAVAVRDSRNGFRSLETSVRHQTQALEEERARAAQAAELRAAGVQVLDTNRWDRWEGPYPLANLPVDVAEHAALDCHAAVVPRYGSTVDLVCMTPQAHLHEPDRGEEAARLAASRAEREAATAAAREARFSFIEGLARGGSPGAGAGLLVAHLIGQRHYYLRVDEDDIAELLGLDVDADGGDPTVAIEAYLAKSTRNVARVIYAAGLALGEAALTDGGSTREACRLHLEHLVEAGYELSDVERDIVADAHDGEEEGE